jgi:hypothetical protein
LDDVLGRFRTVFVNEPPEVGAVLRDFNRVLSLQWHCRGCFSVPFGQRHSLAASVAIHSKDLYFDDL